MNFSWKNILLHKSTRHLPGAPSHECEPAGTNIDPLESRPETGPTCTSRTRNARVMYFTGMRTGTAHLPLHGGKAPAWLFARMVRLAREIMSHLAAEHAPDEILRRLSDPFWFQALGCVLGFDWHSSGLTTTTCGAVKEGIKGIESELGIFACGGKGGTSRKTPGEIEAAFEHTLAGDPAPLVYASRMSAKVDSACVQDGYQLYHHAFFFSRSGKWCVVQQGMSDATRMARRYHWLGEGVTCFVDEPHAAVCCDSRQETMNLVASESHDSREHSAELAARHGEETLEAYRRLPHLELPRRHPVCVRDIDPRNLKKILLKTYESAPRNFEELLGIRGVGPRALRALALISELIYGSTASTRDPARFSFAHGGKDGIPYPVDRDTYEHTIESLRRALDRSRVDRSEKTRAFNRMQRLVD